MTMLRHEAPRAANREVPPAVEAPADLAPMPAALSVSARDRRVLRRLAGRVAELAARAVEHEKRELWYRLNALQPTRPLIFCYPENSWNEIITSDQVICTTELAR